MICEKKETKEGVASEFGIDLSRRAVILGLFPALAPSALARRVGAARAPIPAAPRSDASTFPGLIMRKKEPINLEFSFPTRGGFLMPNDPFHIRTHFDVFKIDAASWWLEIDGHVRQTVALDYQTLRGMFAKTVRAPLECAGNRRVLPAPKIKGTQWEQGAVSNATLMGESEVSRAEVIINGGANWNSADLLGQNTPFAWRLWKYNRTSPARGKHTLMARATDRAGNRQPVRHHPNRRNYMVNFIQPIKTEVR